MQIHIYICHYMSRYAQLITLVAFRLVNLGTSIIRRFQPQVKTWAIPTTAQSARTDLLRLWVKPGSPIIRWYHGG